MCKKIFKIKANFIVNWRWLICLRYNINRNNLFVMKCANAERCVKKRSLHQNVFAKIRSINIWGCMYENTCKYYRFVSDVFLIVYFQFRTCSLHISKSCKIYFFLNKKRHVPHNNLLTIVLHFQSRQLLSHIY